MARESQNPNKGYLLLWVLTLVWHLDFEIWI
jgi:hypothetical protein